jgi:hypothetical protein
MSYKTKKIKIAGTKSKNDYILRFKGNDLYHRVPELEHSE